MPPWIIPEFAPEAPEATSFFSSMSVFKPRIAASRAIPVPLTPPPMMIRSNSAASFIFRCGLPRQRAPWLSLGRLRPGAFQVELLQLLIIDLGRCAGHQISPLLRLGEGNHVADRLTVGEQHGQPVHPDRDPAVGRSSELERVEEEPELRPGLLLADSHRLEDLSLHGRLVNADRAAADLEAVEHHVVAMALHRARIGEE